MMKFALILDRFLTNVAKSCLHSFTLMLIFLAPTQPIFADQSGQIPALTLSPWGQGQLSPFESQAQHDRITQITNYFRSEGIQIIPALPDVMQMPARFALHDATSLRDQFGMTGATLERQREIANMVGADSAWMSPPQNNYDESTWMTPDYHHKGFLPMHDALVMGANSREHIWDGFIQVDTHPFLGQNWHSLSNYYGLESTLSLVDPSDSKQPSWGKITLRYTLGNSEMMDQRPGFDMNTSVQFTDQIALTAGVRQGDAIGLGNYAMLRWQLVKLGQ